MVFFIRKYVIYMALVRVMVFIFFQLYNIQLYMERELHGLIIYEWATSIICISLIISYHRSMADDPWKWQYEVFMILI